VRLIVAAEDSTAQDFSAQDLLVEVERPLTDWIARHTDNTFLLWASDNLVEPTMRILVILAIAWIALRLIRKAIRRAVEHATDPEGLSARKLGARIRLIDDTPRVFSTRRAQRADAMGALFTSVSGFVVWTLALFMILGTFGISLGPLIAGAGLVGIAVGFGAQNLVRDFISGVSMLLEDQYGVGDIIDAGEAVGVVEGISLRTTRIRDVTGTLWHVPNGEITRIGNMSQEWARALLDIGVAYGTDIDAASEIILRVASTMAEEPGHAEEILEPPEVWGVQDLADDSVVIRLVVKTVPGRQWAVARELRRRIKMAFDAANVEIPFPQRTMWLRTEAPVALGDSDSPVFENPVPADPDIDEAVELTRNADEDVTSSPDNELPDPS
jgi:moderate conductance mechanosensitive channel